MPDNSPLLSLPYIQPSQAQKHVTHNEALQRLDAIVQLCVEGFDQTQPPALPEEGLVFALGNTPAGAWSGQGNMLAAFQNGGWTFVTPRPGWRAFGHEDHSLRIWNGTTWEIPSLPLDNLERIGIAATANDSNRLVVASEATLLTHDGAGHQLKINKATAADTASLLFQSGWSGRAEMGVVGNDDFSIKVSSDGNTWQTGLSISVTTGTITVDDLVVPTGVLIGGTQPGNLLSTYETGSYTPSLIDMEGNSVALQNAQTPYVRIGNLVAVFFSFLSNIDTTGLAPTSEVAITLPFINASSSFSLVELRGVTGLSGPFQWQARLGHDHARLRSSSNNSILKVSNLEVGTFDIVGGTLLMQVA